MLQTGRRVHEGGSMKLVGQLMFALFVVTLMLQVGLETSRGDLAKASKHAGALLRGMFVMLVVSPIVAVCMVRMLGLSGPFAVALIVASVAGCVPVSPRGAGVAHGDVPLSVLLMFAVATTTVITAPATAKWLLSFEGEVEMPFGRLLLQLLLLQAAPLALGRLVRDHTYHVEQFKRGARILNAVALVAVALVVLAPNTKTLTAIGWGGVGVSLLMGVTMALLGWLLGGSDDPTRRTMAVMANPSNVGLGLVMMTTAHAARASGVALMGIFLVRMVVGMVVQRILAARPIGDRPRHEVPPVSRKRPAHG
jgi:predicted Na+-dependent transporter